MNPDNKSCRVRDDCPKGYRRADLLDLARKCGVNIKRAPPGKGNKNMSELCADLSQKMKVPVYYASPEAVKSDKKKAKMEHNDKIGTCDVKEECPAGYRRAELVALAEQCGISVKRSPPGKGNKNMSELCGDLRAYERMLSTPSLPAKPGPGPAKPSTQMTGKDKEADCFVREDCPRNYRRADLVQKAQRCDVALKRSPPGKGNKNMKELCEDLLTIGNKDSGSELESVAVLRGALLQRVDGMDSMVGVFDKLLFTHNTVIPTFINMIKGKYSFIRCCEHGYPVSRGAQFRYGLDSQYGEVKMIMKPRFWEKYDKGVRVRGYEFAEDPNFVDLYKGVEYLEDIGAYSKDGDPIPPGEANKEYLKYLMETQARNFNFRHLDEKNRGLVNSGGEECLEYSDKIEERYNEHLRPGPLEKAYPTWCNIQLHLGENVRYSDVMMVIVPHFLTNPKYKDDSGRPLVEIIQEVQSSDIRADGSPNPFKGKLVWGPEVSVTSYYNTFSTALGRKLREEWERKLYREIHKETEASEKDLSGVMQRGKWPYGNSSSVAVASEPFKQETQLYMDKLIEVGFGDRPLVEGKLSDPLSDPLLKSFVLIEDTQKKLVPEPYSGQEDYTERTQELFKKYGYFTRFSGFWTGFGKQAVDAEETEIAPNASNQWKVFLNPSREYFLPVLETVLDALKDEDIVLGKIATNPSAERKGRGAISESPLDPKLVLYFIRPTSKEAQKALKAQVDKVMEKLGEKLSLNKLESISLPCTKVQRPDSETDIEQCGPSFSKQLNPLVYYTQGGFTESGRDDSIWQANMQDIPVDQALAERFEGENFYRYKGDTDPFGL